MAVTLAASLASKLDRAAQTASANAREAGWMLGAYAAMTIATIGRQASTGGVADAVGPKGKLMVESVAATTARPSRARPWSVIRCRRSIRAVPAPRVQHERRGTK